MALAEAPGSRGRSACMRPRRCRRSPPGWVLHCAARGSARVSCCWRTRSTGSSRGARSSGPCAGPAVLGVGSRSRHSAGARHPDERGDRHHQARASEPELAAEPQRLERTSGVGGEIDLLVRSSNLTRPATIEWMSSYESAVLKRFGYSSTRGCGKARLCPAFSLTDLFRARRAHGRAGQADKGGCERPAGRDTAVFLPGRDHLRPPRRDARLRHPPDGARSAGAADRCDALEPSPPAGVSAQLVGLPVLAAKSGAQVSSPWRRIETLLAGLARWRSCCSGLPGRSPPRACAAGADRACDGLVGADPVRGAGALNPMSVTLGRWSSRSQPSSACSSPSATARSGSRATTPWRLCAAATGTPARGRRLWSDGDRRLRRAGAVGHQDAPRLRHRHAHRPERVADRRAGGAAAAIVIADRSDPSACATA